MQRGFSRANLKRLAKKEYQKMKQACSISENINEGEVILGSTDYATERVGDFQVIYDNTHIKQENENNDCQTSAITEEEETMSGSDITASRIDDFQILNENSVHMEPEGGNRNGLGRMEYLIKTYAVWNNSIMIWFFGICIAFKVASPFSLNSLLRCFEEYTNLHSTHIGEKMDKIRNCNYTDEETIDDRFDMMENKLKGYVDSKINIIIKTQGEITAMLKQIIKKHVSLPSEVVFPIQTEEQLRNVNSRMQQDSDLHITTLRTLLLPAGIKKNLQNVMDLNLLSEFNVDGIHGKKSFKEYSAFVNGIFRAVQCEGMTEAAFIADLRNAFKLNKNKYFKNKSRLKLQKDQLNGTVKKESRPRFSFAELHKLKKMKLNEPTVVNKDPSVENPPPSTTSEGHS